MLCFSSIFYHIGNPYSYFPLSVSSRFFPQGCFLSVEWIAGGKNTTGIFGEISDMGPTAWLHVGRERHTAGCGLHRVIPSVGFWGIQKCISNIINKSTVAGWQQLLYPYGDESRQLNSLINAAPIVCCALGGLRNTDNKEGCVFFLSFYSIIFL